VTTTGQEGRRRRRRTTDFTANCPNLQAYLQRISAVQRNFRKFEVEETIDDRGRGRYKRVVATITIVGDAADDSDASLTLQCSNPDYAPTEAEAAAIAPEIADLQFPLNVDARNIDALLAMLPDVDPDDFFSFRRGKNGGVVFVQQRKETNDGKAYLPWSFWSDGEWRMMEPDGPLPLFGLDQLSAWPAVLICEGPKTARAVQRLLADGKDHPWIGDLKDYVPIGWPGGTERWSAVDWQPLANLPPGIRVVVACDNDMAGKNVMTKIARLLQRHSIRALMPDDRWPLNWDLADPFPDHKKWWRGKKYVGPSFVSCLFPATWATKPVKVPGADKPAYVITERFAAEWLYVVEIDSFVHRQHVDRAWSRKQFDARIKAFSDVKDTAVKFMALEASKVEALAYEPDEMPGVINVDGERKLNTFRPTTITPIAGNPRPFLRFMTHLIPSKRERRETLRWMTTVACRPDIRVLYALLLISKMQGVGKTTLALIAANLVGMHNTSFPSEKDVTKSTFNTFIAHRRLAVIHEIYSGERRKAYDTIKSWITEKHVDCNKKFVTPYTISNWCHFIASSNSLLAIHLDDEDRRFFVPRCVEKKQTKEYWNRFYGWLDDDGYCIILNYLQRLAARPQWIVSPGEHAPTSPVKDEIIAEARSPGQQLAHALATIARRRMEAAVTKAATMTEPAEKKRIIDDAKVVFVMPQVHLWMTTMRRLPLVDQKLEKELTLRRAMVAAGMRDSPVGSDGKRKRFMAKFRYGETEPTYPVYVVSNFDIPAHAEWENIKAHHRTPEDVWNDRPVAGGIGGGDGWRVDPHMPPRE